MPEERRKEGISLPERCDYDMAIMKTLSIAASSLLLALSLFAQPAIRMPDASPAATVGQTIGVTDINITYHRPAVNKRKIWGGLVPYDSLWRTGANENTTISFSTPVKIEGQALPAGTYALLRDSGRVAVDADLQQVHRRLGRVQLRPVRGCAARQRDAADGRRVAGAARYTFDDVTNNSAIASLRWEKLRVPMKIEVDLPATVRASIGQHAARRQALGRERVGGGGALGAAQRRRRHGAQVRRPRALARHDRRHAAHEGGGAGEEGRREGRRGAARPREVDRYRGGDDRLRLRPLMGQKKYDDAIAFLNNYATAHPTSAELWRVYAGLGEAYAAKGDAAKAKEYYDKAMAAAHDEAERTEVWDSINFAAAEMK